MGSPFINAINKMFDTYYYDEEMSNMSFEYQLISQEDSLKNISIDGASIFRMR